MLDAEELSNKLSKYNVTHLPDDDDCYELLAFDNEYRKMVTLLLVQRWKQEFKQTPVVEMVMDLNAYYMFSSQVPNAEVSKQALTRMGERCFAYFQLPYETFSGNA